MTAVWRDPPAPGAGPARKEWIDGTVAMLQANVGSWLFVGRWNLSARRTWRRRGCDVTLRESVDGFADFYVRWPEGD